jgi:hypothetical protein
VARIAPMFVTLAIVWVPAARPAAAQIMQDSLRLQQVTAAGAYIVTWTFDEGTGQQTIYLKNTSKDRPVSITAWRVFDCENLKRRSCGEHGEGPTLQPGQTVRLAVVQQQDEEQAYSFRYDFSASYPDDQAAK